jgi:hypothetical protein
MWTWIREKSRGCFKEKRFRVQRLRGSEVQRFRGSKFQRFKVPGLKVHMVEGLKRLVEKLM